VKHIGLLTIAGVAVCMVLISGTVAAQHDPGPRSGAPGAGGALPGLSPDLQAFFNNAMVDFMEVDSVSGTVSGEGGSGLGPTFNGNSCAQCHAHPAVGGSSPATNPQVALANLDGAQNTVPSFITTDGPVREARFIKNSDGTPDGGVHGLYTIAGRTDAEGCVLAQPNFAQQLAANNVIFRIPTPTFGLGLVEATPDSTLLANLAANRSIKSQLGIGGSFNSSGNDGTITRFGWKAQNKSITMFAAEAYNVEMGITNELFPTATEENPDCNGNGKPAPNDVTRTATDDKTNDAFNNPLHILADWMQFQLLMRFTDAPQPDPSPGPVARHGKDVFNATGCALCHTPTMRTAPAMNSEVLENRPVNLFSDLLVHHMGARLADDIIQGAAGPDEFRSTPLWGVGQRLFFLHDGRTSDLLDAINEHASPAASGYPPSEANAVIDNFHGLSPTDKQAILDFLRSL
jgi:CxxC motif-containing protein (DUF1111 family)